MKRKTYDARSALHMAADVAKLSEATTVQGQTVRLSTAGGVKVNDANVIDTVILCRRWTGTDHPGHPHCGASDPGWSLVVR